MSSVEEILSQYNTPQAREARLKRLRGPRDADWWQLLTIDTPASEVDAATSDLNAAMDGVLTMIAEESRADLARALELDATASNSALADALLNRHVYPVMLHHADAGASDTEPRENALELLHYALCRSAKPRLRLVNRP